MRKCNALVLLSLLASPGWAILLLAMVMARPSAGADPSLRVGTFDVDASPPIGSPLAYDPCKEVT
ncbi:MAG TPA: hypothetical protein EYP14_08475, partial [Planctomycetaceae bacterium]|nr:hypothetical protein [Planctomycetaceae bacterium]